MKPMLTAFAAIVLIAIGAYFILSEMKFSSQDQAAGEAVRLSN